MDEYFIILFYFIDFLSIYNDYLNKLCQNINTLPHL